MTAVHGEVLAPELKCQIAEYSQTALALATLRERYQGVLYDVTDKQQLVAAKEARSEIKGYRVALEKTRVAIKAPALERCRLIDAEAKQITGELEKLETPIDDQIKAEERRAAEAERVRCAKIQTEVERLKATAVRLVGKSSALIGNTLELLRSEPLDPSFYAEFLEAATLARDGALATLEIMEREALAREAEVERMRIEREDLDRRQAEQRQREAEEDRQRQERRQREEAELAERRRAVQAEEDRQAATRREQEERDRAARAAQERTEREAREAQEAQARAVRQEALAVEDARSCLQVFLDTYGERPEFAGVAKSIKTYFKKHPA